MIDGYVAGYDAWNECHPDNPEYKIKAMSEKYCTVCGNPVYTASTIAAGRCQSCFEKDQSPQPVPAPKVGEEWPILTRLDIAVIKEKLINELASFRELLDHEGSNLEEAFEYGYLAAIRQSNHMLNIRGKDIPTTPETEQLGEQDEKHIHISLGEGVTARVSPNASPELLASLSKMVELAKQMPDVAPTAQPGESEGGEVPYEVMEWIKKLADAYGRSNIYSFPWPQSEDFDPITNQSVPFEHGALAMYHRDQSTITALQQERDAYKDKWERAQKDIAALTDWFESTKRPSPGKEGKV